MEELHQSTAEEGGCVDMATISSALHTRWAKEKAEEILFK